MPSCILLARLGIWDRTMSIPFAEHDERPAYLKHIVSSTFKRLNTHGENTPSNIHTEAAS